MPLGTFIAGPYNGTYNAEALGLTEDGFEIRLRAEKELINQTHLYGDSVIDAVYRGGNCLIAFVVSEFAKVQTLGALWPYGPANSSTTSAVTPAVGYGFLGTIGRCDVGSSIYKAMVLTAVAGTTAAASPATMTASQVIKAEAQDTQYMLAPRHRKTPLVLRAYPYTVTNPAGYATGTYEVWFTQA